MAFGDIGKENIARRGQISRSASNLIEAGRLKRRGFEGLGESIRGLGGQLFAASQAEKDRAFRAGEAGKERAHGLTMEGRRQAGARDLELLRQQGNVDYREWIQKFQWPHERELAIIRARFGDDKDESFWDAYIEVRNGVLQQFPQLAGSFAGEFAYSGEQSEFPFDQLMNLFGAEIVLALTDPGDQELARLAFESFINQLRNQGKITVIDDPGGGGGNAGGNLGLSFDVQSGFGPIPRSGDPRPEVPPIPLERSFTFGARPSLDLQSGPERGAVSHPIEQNVADRAKRLADHLSELAINTSNDIERERILRLFDEVRRMRADIAAPEKMPGNIRRIYTDRMREINRSLGNPVTI